MPAGELRRHLCVRACERIVSVRACTAPRSDPGRKSSSGSGCSSNSSSSSQQQPAASLAPPGFKALPKGGDTSGPPNYSRRLIVYLGKAAEY